MSLPALIVETNDSPPDSTGTTWTNVTDYCLSVSTFRGRQYDEDTFQPGRLNIVLDNTDGRFDPDNATGPLYGKLGVNYPWRVSFPGTYLAYGYTDVFSRTWPGGSAYSETSVSCTDRFKLLNKKTIGPLTRSATAPGEGTDVRMNALLTAAGVGTGSSSRRVNAGGWTTRNVEATTYPAKTNAFTSMQDINTAEGGVFYVNGAGVVVYDGAAARTNETRSNTVQALYQFGRTAYASGSYGSFDVNTDFTIVYDDQLYTNFVRVTDWAGVEHTWPITYPTTNPVELDLGQTLLNGVDAMYRARDLYARRFQVMSRIDQVTLDCSWSTDYQTEALTREISDRITLRITPPGAPIGTSFSQDYYIESIAHDINYRDGRWFCTFGLAPVPPVLPPSFVSASQARDNSNTGSLTVSAPATTTAGNFLTAVFYDFSGNTITAPAGWTLVTSSVDANGYGAFTVFKKVATASEPASYTFTGGTYAYVGILQYAAGTTVRATSFSGSATSSTAPVTPTIASLAGDVVLAVYGARGGKTLGTTPTNYVQRLAGTPGNVSNVNFAVYETSTSVAGTQGGAVSSFSPADFYYAATIAIT